MKCAVFSTDESSIKKIQNCRAYDNGETCKSCNRGFYINGDSQCKACEVKNCDLCYAKNNGKKCYSCKMGFYPNKNHEKCKKIDSEGVYDPSTRKCLQIENLIEMKPDSENTELLTSKKFKVPEFDDEFKKNLDGRKKMGMILNLIVDFKEKNVSLNESRN